jgi:chromosome segregation ATPase
LLPV